MIKVFRRVQLGATMIEATRAAAPSASRGRHVHAAADHREIKYRGSKPFNELRKLAPAIAASVVEGTMEHQFLEAIHLHKYNKSYDDMFESLDDMCGRIITANPVIGPNLGQLEVAIIKSYIHHCDNLRYGYALRPASKSSMRRDAEVYLKKVERWEGKNDGGPTWWQDLESQH